MFPLAGKILFPVNIFFVEIKVSCSQICRIRWMRKQFRSVFSVFLLSFMYGMLHYISEKPLFLYHIRRFFTIFFFKRTRCYWLSCLIWDSRWTKFLTYGPKYGHNNLANCVFDWLGWGLQAAAHSANSRFDWWRKKLVLSPNNSQNNLDVFVFWLRFIRFENKLLFD